MPSELKVSDTVVACRPHQLKEAAIVLSCVPAGHLAPLVVVEPPPVSEQQYRNLYDEYKRLRNIRDDSVGAALGRKEVLAGRGVPAVTNDEIDRAAERLTPYRSWVQHNRLQSRVLEPLKLRRVVLLFDATPEELRLIEPVPRDYISDERFPIFSESISWVYLLPSDGQDARGHHQYASLAQLTEVAWTLFHGENSRVENAVDVEEGDVGSFLTGLLQALEHGLPLRPQANSVRLQHYGEAADGGTEAVLIEVSNDATRLLGVLYAYRQQAKLIVYPEPNRAPIEAALSEMQLQQEETAKAARYLIATRDDASKSLSLEDAELAALDALTGPPDLTDDDAFGPKTFRDLLHRLITGDDSPAIIRRIEQAVSSAVPSDVVMNVGERHLTALTAGVPYNFVKQNGVDWSRKSIGHITGDASVLLLTELFGGDIETDVGFNLVFDPGYFSTGETRDVLSELRRRVSYALLLEGTNASVASLIHLSSGLPVELVFFNTHGSEDAILLNDMPLPAFKLVQRIRLESRPIVFNSSCLSWVGVGRNRREYCGGLYRRS